MESTKRRVLLADASAETRFALTQLLGVLGYDLVAVETAKQALEAAHKGSFNLYILNTWFLEESGIGLCHWIRAFDPNGPIIIYSQRVLESERQDALLAGADAFVAKPRVDELVETIDSLLGFEVKVRAASGAA